MGEDLERFFVNVKPARILVKLNNQFSENYPSQIAGEVGATYSHTVRIVHRLEDYGLIESHKEGRKKLLELTDDGTEVAKKCSELLTELEEFETEN